MNLYGGKPFWPVRNGLLAVYPALDQNVETEVVIVGAGVTGALVAWHLAQAGVRCVIVDRRDASLGSTCASTALLQYEIDVPLHVLARRIGEKRAVRAYKCSLAALAALGRINRALPKGHHFKKVASLQGAPVAAQVRGLRAEHELRLRHGFRSEYWSRAQVRAKSSLPYHAALRSPDAAQMDPHQFTCALLADCVANGVRVFDRTEITQRKMGKVITLTTAQGFKLRARHLVIAAGYETEPELPDYLAQLYSTYALVTEPLEDKELRGWPKDHVIWETSHPYHYLRRTDDGRILIGGGDVPFTSGAKRDRQLPSKQVALERRLRHLFPRFTTQTAYSWGGTFAETRDGLPCIGRCPHKPDNVYYTLGYGGNGITFSLIAAEMIRDLIGGERSPYEDLFRMDRESLRP